MQKLRVLLLILYHNRDLEVCKEAPGDDIMRRDALYLTYAKVTCSVSNHIP